MVEWDKGTHMKVIMEKNKKEQALLRGPLKIQWGGYSRTRASARLTPQFSELLLSC